MFYDVFTRLCAEKGVSESGAAQAVGLNRAAVQKWKKGATPTGAVINAFATYFGVSADVLLGLAPEGGHDILEDVDLAFYGDYRTLSEDDREAVRDFVRLMRERRAKKDRK